MDLNQQNDIYTLLNTLATSLIDDNSLISTVSKEFKTVERTHDIMSILKKMDSDNVILKLLMDQINNLGEYLNHAQILKLFSAFMLRSKNSTSEISIIASMNKTLNKLLMRILEESADNDLSSSLNGCFSLDISQQITSWLVIRGNIKHSPLEMYLDSKSKARLIENVKQLFWNYVQKYDVFTKEEVLLSLSFQSVRKLKNRIIDFKSGIILKLDEQLNVKAEIGDCKVKGYIFRKDAAIKELSMEYNIMYFEKLREKAKNQENTPIILFFQHKVDEALKETLHNMKFIVLDALGEKKISEMKENLNMTPMNELSAVALWNECQPADLIADFEEIDGQRHIILNVTDIQNVQKTTVFIKEDNPVIFEALRSIIRTSLNELMEILLSEPRFSLGLGNFTLNLFLYISEEVLEAASEKEKIAFTEIIVPVLLEEIFKGNAASDKVIDSTRQDFDSFIQSLEVLRHFGNVEKIIKIVEQSKNKSVSQMLRFVVFEKEQNFDVRKLFKAENSLKAVDTVPELLKSLSSSDWDKMDNMLKKLDMCLVSKNIREYIFAVKLFDFFVRLRIITNEPESLKPEAI